MAKPPQQPKVRATCPTCFRVEEEDRLNCPNRQLQMCPTPEALVDDRMVEIACEAPCGGPCGKHMALPLGNVMKRRQLTNLGACAYDVCRARVVHPSDPNSKLPAPITDDAAGK